MVNDGRGTEHLWSQHAIEVVFNHLGYFASLINTMELLPKHVYFSCNLRAFMVHGWQSTNS